MKIHVAYNKCLKVGINNDCINEGLCNTASLVTASFLKCSKYSATTLLSTNEPNRL